MGHFEIPEFFFKTVENRNFGTLDAPLEIKWGHCEVCPKSVSNASLRYGLPKQKNSRGKIMRKLTKMQRERASD